ncbi:Outer membrane protein assembly factor BamE precursor [Legionella clemsonensis]|uniref:Outer membrane protein assembly factor BamE n=1 Tax=Legionella clemsonensis TaxID=1867846 RepID=A0A222P5P8_9GAMM|nr:outer membrane protein assembly factor BamE [Legionella clemsonensis]ASQ47168.1 Outer membrane protein assembly factor BamE precursor [Legionella clemsonensis]
MRIKIVLITVITIMLSFSLTNCISYDYARRIVQQGNLLPQSKIERLKLGMSKNDVAILMGTSLLSPTFNNERWDYAYTWRRGAGPLTVRYLSLYFSHNRLVKIEHKP